MIRFTKSIMFLILFAGIWFYNTYIYAETNIEEKIIQIGQDLPFAENQHFRQGSNVDPKGRVLDLNNYFIRYAGKPIIPVMSEIHYTRYPKNEWEEALLKMKASGIQIIALYCFWLHHEEEEGNIRFDENRNVREFIELCGKHGLWAFPRLGPWCHGECRNGGFPDWFAEQRENAWDRGYKGELDPAVKRWYQALAEQFKGLYFKDGGPIIGIQVDNEVPASGPDDWGYQYMSDLRNYAVEIGIDVPLYTVTGWPGPQVPEDLVIGLFGAYPAAPWTQHINKLPPQNGFLFSTNRMDQAIGSDWGFNEIDRSQISMYRYPFLTVEMAGGNQISYHRRPQLIGKDMLALVYTRLGVGANMMGYYVYHGTQHPLSWHNAYPTQESKTTFHPYPNDYPMISYDFMAPLTEWGFIRDDYHDFKLIHQFLCHFGSDIAPMYAYLPEDNPTDPSDGEHLRYTVRSRSESGYVFFNNYVRQFTMKDHNQVRFKIQMDKETLNIPDNSIDIPNGIYGVIPFNYHMDGILLKYATAHPFNIIDSEEKIYYFYAMKGIDPEFKFDKSTIKAIEVKNGQKIESAQYIRVNQLIPGKACQIQLLSNAGKKMSILLLTEEEARYTYEFRIHDQQTLVMTNHLAFYNEPKEQLEIRSMGESEFDFYTCPKIKNASKNIKPAGMCGRFVRYHVALTPCELPHIQAVDVTDRMIFDKYCQSLHGKTPEGPTYSHRLEKRSPYSQFQLNLPDTLPSGINDLLIYLDYRGNTAQIYADSLLIADAYYSGFSMPFALRRHQDKLGKSRFIFQVTPLMPNYDIYFEESTDLGFVENQYSGLNGIKVIPEYSIKLK